MMNTATPPSPEPSPFKFNVGAFLLAPFWSLAHRVWIGLLAFAPMVASWLAGLVGADGPVTVVLGVVGLFVYFAIAVHLGKRGTELAFEKSSESDRAVFQRKQRKWMVAGVVCWAAVLGLIVSLIWRPVTIYIDNKSELNQVIKKYDQIESRLLKEIGILLESDPIKELYGGASYTPVSELKINDTDLWHLKHDYDFADLSQRKLTFPEPRLNGAEMRGNLSDGRKLALGFGFDADHNINRVSYAYPETFAIFGMEQYLDQDQINEILR